MLSHVLLVSLLDTFYARWVEVHLFRRSVAEMCMRANILDVATIRAEVWVDFE